MHVSAEINLELRGMRRRRHGRARRQTHLQADLFLFELGQLSQLHSPGAHLQSGAQLW
jgi:hypothetical protein